MTAREKLKSATAKAAHLERQRAQLETALEMATTAVETASKDLETFNDLSAAIVRWRVEQTKKGLSAKTLPEILRERVDAKRLAEEELEQSTSTRDAISEELEDIKKRLLPVDQTKTECALDVLREELADKMAAELQELNERRRDLNQILKGLANVNLFLDNRMQFVGYTPAMSKATTSCDYEFSGGLDPIGELGARWLARLNALKADPDVEVTIPSVIVPSDYVMTPGTYDPQRIPNWTGGSIKLRSEESIVAKPTPKV